MQCFQVTKTVQASCGSSVAVPTHSSCQATVLAVSADLVELIKGLQPLYVVQLVVLFLYRPQCERRQQQ